jgi:CPA2 family monovalent cation:H+ antiporter-2
VYAIVETTVKAGAFVAVMLVAGKRAIPWLLHYVAHTGSRELFRLAVLAIALGVAYGAALLFGVSFALGAFFAGMVMGESELSENAARDALPLRDAFAVLFFVSVGMLFEPSFVLREPLPLLATVLIILVGKSLAAYAIVRAFGYPSGIALTISASLAQIGEFSFILAGLGVSLQVLPEGGRDLILAGAIFSILLNPIFFSAIERFGPRIAGASRSKPMSAGSNVTREPLVPTTMTNHVIVVGYGGVGRTIAQALNTRAFPFVVVEERAEFAAEAASIGIEIITGNAATTEVLEAANIVSASALVVAISSGFEAGQVVAQAKERNPGLKIVARAHSDAELEHLNYHGADSVVMGEREIGAAMVDALLRA